MLTKEQEEIPIKLLPQKPGQMRTMLITGEAPERGHWYSPDAVREMLAQLMCPMCAAGAKDIFITKGKK